MLALALAAPPTYALDIDQIEVKSQLGQPLVAEIPIIAGDPAELSRVQAQLASSITFARVGLARPIGIVLDLRFKLARDARGRLVIRVSSALPVQQEFLTFLVEVDWGSGHMVREYSVALAAPRSLQAPVLVPVQEATLAPSDRIVREPEPVPDPMPVVGPEVSEPTTASAPVQRDIAMPASMPVAPPPAVAAREAREADAISLAPSPRRARPAAPTSAPEPASAPAPASRPPPSPVTRAPGDYGPVKTGETLSRIAGNIGNDDYSLDQTMLALLAANPQAFARGNINLLKRGAVLRLPPPPQMSQYNVAQAAMLVREQTAQWRENRLPAPQPVVLAGVPATTHAPAITAPIVAPRTTQARLEIAPPSAADVLSASTQSGLSVGGEGDRLRTSPQPVPGTFAARDAEAIELQARELQVCELQMRVEALETLRQDQGKLIALQDSELTARPRERTAPWLWLIAALPIGTLLGGWFSRRRASAQPTRPAFAAVTLQASPPPPVPESEPVDSAIVKTAATAGMAQAAGSHSPTWHSGRIGDSTAD